MPPSSISLPLLLLLTLPAVVQAQFTFTINNGAIGIVYPSCVSGAVTIPSETNGYPVTSIGAYAFDDCLSLTSVTIGTNVTSIGTDAFANCSRLGSVTIPNSVTSIGGGAFFICTMLTAITVDTNNPAYSSVNGVLFDKSHTTLVEYPGGIAGSYTIPNSVTNVGGFAFGHCISLTSVTIPNSVTSIGDYVFFSCYNLANVTMGTNVTSIADYAFSECTSLTSVSIPKSVTTIERATFATCTSLTNVTIGTNVTSIGDSAFYGCSSLISVTIPNSVTNIGINAFSSCTKLTAIMVDTRNSVYSDLDGVLFNQNLNTLVEYPCGLDGNYTIPNSVTSIGDSSFSDCSGLTSVTIPDSVTNIGDNAFYGCTSLTSVYFAGNAPSLGVDVFGDWFVVDPATIYYLPGTTGWDEVTNETGLPVVLWNPQAQAAGVLTNPFGFTITGTTDIPIVVEASINLQGASWTPLQTCTLTNGSIYFSDPQSTNYQRRFYRIRSP